MNHYKFRAVSATLKRALTTLAVVASVAVSFTSCLDVDSTLGSDLIPEDQGLKLGRVELDPLKDGVNYFETRLFRTDSIQSSNPSTLYFGQQQSDTFGLRTFSFFSQYTPGNTLGEDFFGYKPIIDSIMLRIYSGGYDGDTTVVQSYAIYGIKDDTFITEAADTTFFPTFEIENYVDKTEPLFTFNYPDQANGVYVGSTSVRLTPTTSGRALVNELLFIDDNADYTIDTAEIRTIYEDNTLWIDQFKGLYLTPTSDLGTAAGAVYSSDILYSGMTIFGRSREEADPTIIKDTVGMTFVFYPIATLTDDDIDEGKYFVGGEVAINLIDHDYTSSLIDIDNGVVTPHTENYEDIAEVSTIYVEGMAGVVTQFVITPEMLLKIDSLIDEEFEETGDEYTSIFFNQATLNIYLTDNHGANRDWTLIDPLTITPWINTMPSTLGLYSNYADYTDEDGASRLIGISDYNYSYESLGISLDFGGTLNRSKGYYTFNIPSYLQTVWNSYLAAKADADDIVEDIDWTTVERTFYLAPRATALNTPLRATLQSTHNELNAAPITFTVTYTLIN